MTQYCVIALKPSGRCLDIDATFLFMISQLALQLIEIVHVERSGWVTVKNYVLSAVFK